MADLIPIGTILALLTNQIIRTSAAAKDVVFEKESFKVLSEHLSGIQDVLNKLQSQKLNDSPAARKALESLENEIKKANSLLENYKNRGRFYLLIKCRHIVKEVQEVTRDIGKSLAAISLANIEVLSEMSDQVSKLQNEMQRAELEDSQSQQRIVDKLNQALKDQVQDQDFANDMLKEIARAVGVPVEPAEISKELESLKKEREEAANRKERAEVLFLQQVIELLSRADAARNYDEVRNQYIQRLKVIERYDPKEECIQPFKAFICSITGAVMVDPVSICTGTSCERSAIQDWFSSGEKTDPATGENLEDFSYRPNLRLRQSIQEWRELNYCVKIRSCKEKLQGEEDSSVKEALGYMQALIRENVITKDWISIGGLTEILVSLIGHLHDDDVNIQIMITLKDLVEDNRRNKDIFTENQGLDNIIPSLGLGSSISKAALDLLYEVLHENAGWNTASCNELSQKENVIIFLVKLLESQSREVAEKAEEILLKLCDEDEKNIVKAAEANWYKPLIDGVNEGSNSSRISIVRALVSLQLDEDQSKLVGAGLIRPLLEMVSENTESKDVSLSALVKLSRFHDNKELIAEAGGVPLILELMFSHIRTFIISKCSEILANLSSNGDGVKFLVDENGIQLKMESVITNMLAIQENLTTSDIVRRPALRALLQICQSDAALVKSAVLSASGVSVILPLLDDSNEEIRETAINLIFLFSQQEPQGVVEHLLKPRRLEALVGFLENEEKSDVQMAAAGLLANLPKSEVSLTEKLIELGGLNAIISILSSGSVEAKENALSALFRFTDPTNIQLQRSVVELGAYPLIVSLLRDGSVTAKARAAALLGDLSMLSSELANMPKQASCWCIRRKRGRICPLHGVVCSVHKTFCLLEGDALPDLVRLLTGEVHATAYEAIQTLSTMVQEESPHRGANVLHAHDAIGPMIDILRWGSVSLKAEALGLLEKVFMSKDMADLHGSIARLALVGLTGGRIYDEGHLQRKAARVMLLIDRYSRSSSSRNA